MRTYTGDPNYLITEIDVIHFRIDEVDDEIHLSEEKYLEFIIVCTEELSVAKKDIDTELSCSDKNGDDELVFSPISTRRRQGVLRQQDKEEEGQVYVTGETGVVVSY